MVEKYSNLKFSEFVASKSSLQMVRYEDDKYDSLECFSIATGKSDLCYLFDIVSYVAGLAVRNLEGHIAYDPDEMLKAVLIELYTDNYDVNDRDLGEKRVRFLKELKNEMNRHLKHYDFGVCDFNLVPITRSTSYIAKTILHTDVIRVTSARDLGEVNDFQSFFLTIGQKFIDGTDICSAMMSLYFQYLQCKYPGRKFYTMPMKQDDIAKDFRPIAQITLDEFQKHLHTYKFKPEDVDIMAHIYAKYTRDKYIFYLHQKRMKTLATKVHIEDTK